LGPLTVTAGLRNELVRPRYTDLATGAESAHTISELLPGLGVYYALTPQLGVLGGVYRGFSPPAPDAGAPARPELSVNWEAGLRYSRRQLVAEVIGFYNDYSNLTDICTLSSGCVEEDLDRQFNAGKARIYGVEANARHEVPLGVSSWAGRVRLPVSLAYTLTRAEFQTDFQSADPIFGDVTAGDEMPYIPRHELRAGIGVETPRFGLDGAATYVSRMRELAGSGPMSETLATDEQYLVDATGWARIASRVRLYLNVRNLLDDRFIVARRPFGARPNAPRWVQLGTRIEL
jgi:Fe(3+) dicitrate transport protein